MKILPASKAGIKEGDVITQVNGKDIAGVDELRNEIRDVKEGDALKLTYKRDGKNQSAEIKIPKRLKSADL
ncbi:MAG: PDZ domain-containing protein [Segetibacter sp.]